MANNFVDRVKAGQKNITVLNTAEAKAKIDATTNPMIIDVRDAETWPEPA